MKLQPLGKVAVGKTAKKQRRARAAMKKARELLDLWAEVDRAKASSITLDELRRRYIERQAARGGRRRRAA
jgi:hypothetical protein